MQEKRTEVNREVIDAEMLVIYKTQLWRVIYEVFVAPLAE